MEGVLVNARSDGANFTVTVVSDAQGRYSVPRTHVGPGTYRITIRATGYDLIAPGPVEVDAGKTASRDRQLQKTERDLALEIRRVQDEYKFLAVMLPPIPPLVLAVIVFGWRRRLEKVGVPQQRMRGGRKHGQTTDE